MKQFFLLLAGALLLFSCKKDPDFNKLDTNLLVQTGYDTTAIFTNYKTYAISDTINLVSNLTTKDYWADNQSTSIINQIKTNMANSHYMLIKKADKPDLAVNLTFIYNIQQSISYDPFWYDNLYYGSMYWGYSYPYSGGFSLSEYKNTALLIEVIDLKNAQTNKNLKVIWNATITGAFDKSTAENQAMILRAVDTSFKQSSYLITN
jgi:uncharacterized protein YcfL